MVLDAAALTGRATFVTGPERGCGKTTVFLRALGLLRAAGEAPAFLAVGLEGAAEGRGPRPVAVAAGEVFVSAERFLRNSDCEPELLDAVPGRSALGRLAVARARRPGGAVLVGPERNEHAACAIRTILASGWARSVLVDGAMNRITQVASFPGARFVFAVRVGGSDLERQARAVRRLYRLATLPPAPGPDAEGLHEVRGPLTAATIAALPPEARTIAVEDFTKVFLDGGQLSSLLRGRALAVRSPIEFGGFVVALRDLSRERFEEALGDPGLAAMVAYNPYEAARAPARRGAEEAAHA